jgi:hypothetical protein
MDLIAYALKKEGTGTLLCPVLAQVAKDAECSVGTLYMIAKGHKLAGPKLASRIEEATSRRGHAPGLCVPTCSGPPPDSTEARPRTKGTRPGQTELGLR